LCCRLPAPEAVTTRTLIDRGWLDALVATELDRHDPEAALSRLPVEIRAAAVLSTDLAPAGRLLVTRSLRFLRLGAPPADPTTAFLDEVRGHVHLVLDLAVLRRLPFHRERGRLEIAALLAAALGEVDAALEALPVVPISVADRDIDEAVLAAERALVERFHPPGDPVLGLPLHPGLVAILRRRLARIAMGFHRDRRLEPDALARHASFADRETVFLVEALAGLVAADEAPDERARLTRQRQMARLGVSRASAREARTALAAPRPPGTIAAAAPDRTRPFLVQQLHLALLRARLGGEGAARFVEAFVAAAELDAPTLAAARVEAAAQHGDHQVWFEALDDAGKIDWQALAGQWEAAADAVVDRVSTALSDNLGAIVTEIRQTGEVGQLLARAAAGAKLNADERRKVRLQLIDLAKAVPALAIFAAPGGMLLLPLLAKLLPFNLLPSAWDKAAAPKALPAPAAEAEPKEPKP
jgi:hypothetical protein